MLSLRARSLFWRRPPLAFSHPASVHRRRLYNTEADEERPAEPFRVLFCGSDVFSVAVLEALLGAEGGLGCSRYGF